MKKWPKKLTLHRETLCSLEDPRRVVGGFAVKTVDVTLCVTNCPACNLTAGTNCCP
jgi:hypothetical protein